jgi:hypothetical protein
LSGLFLLPLNLSENLPGLSNLELAERSALSNFHFNTISLG